MKDEYVIPDIVINWGNQFVIDSLVYSLYNNSSYQKSKNNFKNEFFWMSKEEMLELANTNHYTELYTDARTSNNRHVHNLLFGEERIYDKLSPDAKLVLDYATELTKKSMKARQMMADTQNHLNSWDAGYAQLKLVWKEYFPEELKEFRQLYKNLEDRMRPLVYELGFLLK
jgi:TRAP-type mannitol/chloroaromatic compound transport system substrate-binding protein